VRTELFSEGIHPVKQFSRCIKLILFQIGQFINVEEIHVSLETKPSLLELEHLEHCFPMCIELVFERNTSSNPGDLRWR
jgi:hypothetical protein